MENVSDQARMGEVLKQLRLAARLSQQAAAESAGISINSIGRYESGEREVPLSVIRELASVYDASVEQVLRLDELSNQLLPTHEIPVLGYVSAGTPRDAWELDLGTVPIPDFILREAPKSFALIISGESLSGDAISDGDVVVVDPEAIYQVDKIYIVRLDDGEVTAKHMKEVDGQMMLWSSNADYENIQIRVSGQGVLGRVVWHIRRM